jgi:LPXTG-motif cell wall-anchored protein
MSRPKFCRATIRLAASLAIAAVLGVLVSSAAFASNAPQWVIAADVGTARAAAGATSWFADPTHNGTFATSASTFDASTALQLSTPAQSDGIRVMNSYGSGVTPPTIAQITSGASYTYSGSNVDFQIELFFAPSDSGYGPDPANGVNKCTAAGAAYPGMCYTVIKWEPLATSVGAWSTVDLSSNAALTPTTGGWKNTNEIGIYPKPGPLIGDTLSEYLAQMSSYQVLAVGVALGSGAAAPTGYVKTMTYAAQTYNFQSEPLVAPQIVSPPSDKGTVGATYSRTVSVTGTGPFTYAIVSGALPAGLTLDPSAGIISGVPASKGTSSFMLSVVGTGGTTTQSGTIAVGAIKTLAETGADILPGLALAGALILAAFALMIAAKRRRA